MIAAQLNINGSDLTYVLKEHITTNNLNQYQCFVNPDISWDGMTINVYFNNIPSLVNEENIVQIPSEALIGNKLEIGIVGMAEGKKYTTNIIFLRLVEGINSEVFIIPDPPVEPEPEPPEIPEETETP